MSLALSLAHPQRRPLPVWAGSAGFAADFAEGLYAREGQFVPPGSAYGVSRATTRRALAANGEWLVFSPNVPALTDLGLSIEPSGTNHVRNSAFAGAVPSTTDLLDGLPAGWDRAKIDGTGVRARLLSTGTWLGLPAITIRLWGNSTVGDAELRWFVWGEIANNLAAGPGETVLSSAYIAIIEGSLANLGCRMRLTERDAGGTCLVKHTVPLSPSAAPQRVTHGVTMSHASAVRASIGFEFGFSGAFDVTLRIAGAQVEKTASPLPSSPILTTSGAVARAADTLTLYLPERPTDLTVTDATGNAVLIAGRSEMTTLTAAELGTAPIRSIIGAPG